MPLVTIAMRLIRARRPANYESSHYIFHSIGDVCQMIHIDYHWYKAVASAGLVDFRFHDLRHTAASYLAMTGATTNEIAEILGHKTLDMVKRYAHLTTSHSAKVLERMQDNYYHENN